MRTSPVLLASAVAALLILQCFSAPCNDGETSVEASKTSKSSNTNSASCDDSSKEVKAKNANGEYSAKSSSKSTKTASASSSESTETYKAYKSGAPPCGDTLPPKKCGESDEDYYKRIFVVKECDKASVSAFYVKVFKQYKGESDKDYVKRIDFIFTKVYKSLDVRTDDVYLRYLEKYYTIKYARLSGETEKAYFARTITKTTETEEEYNDKIVILKRYCKDVVDWTKITVDYKSKTGYIYKETTSTSTGKSLDSGSSFSEVEIKKEIVRKEGETDEVYYKRIIIRKSTTVTDQEYVTRVTYIRKSYPNLDVWYNVKYFSIVKDYYTTLYVKQSCEDDDKYYARICGKESWETDEQAARRADVVRHLYPNLKLWYDEKYYVTYTKKIYTVVFKKDSCEDETTYFKRVVIRVDKETDVSYVSRLDLIVKTYSSLTLWYSDKTYSIVKVYYTVKYAKKSGECDEVYIKRLVTKDVSDCDDEVYAKRIYLVHKSTVSFSGWYDDTYYETYTKKYYSVFYKKGDKETCTAWLTRVIVLIEGECEDNAIKRITLINKSKSGCSCWTSENIKKIECSFKSDYIVKIKKAFIKTSSVEVKRSSKSSSCNSADSSESSSQVSIHN